LFLEFVLNDIEWDFYTYLDKDILHTECVEGAY